MKHTHRETHSRRKFVEKAGIGLASMAFIPKFNFLNTSQAENKVRIGIIGVNGEIARPGIIKGDVLGACAVEVRDADRAR